MAVEDKKLAIKRQFLRYIHPLKSITNAVDQKKCWIEQMKYLVQDFKTLLNLSFKEFWSTVVFNKQATMGLCTFLQEAAPPHLMDQLPQDSDVLTIYNEIDHFAYKLFKRLTTSSENEENFMSPHYMWSLLCNNNIISIPMLYDICSIYGQSYKKELEIIFIELFTCQKLYKENLIHSIQFTIKCLSQFQDKIELEIDYGNHIAQSNKTSTEIEETNLCMIEDIINFLLDTSYSISNFLEIYPLASIFFYQEKLHLKIASFYHSIKPLIYKKVVAMNKLEKFQEKLHASRLLLVKSVKQCLIHIPTKTTNKSESAVEEYLEAVSELLAYNEFVNDYNVVYNLTKDIKKYQKSNKEIDSTRYDYLLKSLELINKPYTELEQKELQEQHLEVQTSSTNIENARLRSLINNVKDLLPHLGDGFIQKCLEYYDMDSEKVINMVLEDCLPSELTQYEFNLPLMTEDEDASGYDPSIKGNKKLKKLKAVLDDKSFRNEMRPFYEKYNFTEITCAELESYYNDEYDDTYDEVEYVIPEPTDENEKRRPDVIPRVLIEKKAVTEFVEEEFSDDEPQQVLNFQPFCENPEEVRERQARRYAAKQSLRSNRNKPQAASSSATSSGSNVELDRQRKNENKAFSGNHNRRNAARNKQQRGMF
ncbi:activating signal cointegrator 1 complex subunit 2 isoform X1 [Acyrthosiphon pisum]|uniref:CUE domain-containing protein n=1 Tax=Acyrthosiphon pisum TaxID=7029 RepID=A0A8R2A3L2_ACYPI|nr:activating signal cointegrator 1 complex subunit 2 isoform X1 [Acyrthosiphon pisum]XP_008184664.1 activating signal cointegrator 1 complex subunit 2 isoform X1 [Acyrthosiphon pisum]|eukprot:XP_001944181.1 PREDICTED: activating signal cointegrator 1 complex subunit 2 isoform X1 [Acyrthosiphon pisum]